MIELTQEQRQELDRPGPPLVRDPKTNATYVLVPDDVYQRLRGLLENDDLDMRQVAVLVEQAMREDDEGDPTLAFYQRKYGKGP
jgi:hypothetical protein